MLSLIFMKLFELRYIEIYYEFTYDYIIYLTYHKIRNIHYSIIIIID